VGVENAADAVIDQALGAGGLMTEGASEPQRSLGSPPLADPEMVPTANDIDANYADLLASGLGVSTLPVDVSDLIFRGNLAPGPGPFDQTALEEGSPIPIPEPPPPILDLDQENNDPLYPLDVEGEL
jgi:hypothetical protein